MSPLAARDASAQSANVRPESAVRDVIARAVQAKGGIDKQLQGRKPGDRRVRVERPQSEYFRYSAPGTLVARPEGNEYHWDVRLQGDGETVFFAA